MPFMMTLCDTNHDTAVAGFLATAATAAAWQI
jgi:hypothetical protein